MLLVIDYRVEGVDHELDAHSLVRDFLVWVEVYLCVNFVLVFVFLFDQVPRKAHRLFVAKPNFLFKDLGKLAKGYDFA